MGGGRKEEEEEEEKKGAVAPFWVSVSGFVFERKRVFPFLFLGRALLCPQKTLWAYCWARLVRQQKALYCVSIKTFFILRPRPICGTFSNGNAQISHKNTTKYFLKILVFFLFEPTLCVGSTRFVPLA